MKTRKPESLPASSINFQGIAGVVFLGPISFQQKESLRGREVSSLQSVEIHTTRKIRTVELDLVNSRVLPLIHQR